MAYDIVNFEPVYVDDKQSDNFGRWLESGENRYRDFMNTEHGNGTFYVVCHSAKVIRKIKKVIRKDYFYGDIADAERSWIVFKDERGVLLDFFSGTNKKLLKIEQKEWNSRRKEHFMSKYGDYEMPESLRRFMGE